MTETSRRTSISRWTFFLLVVLVALTIGQEIYSETDLQAMADDELEKICLVRGFELAKDEIDPETGLAYKFTHDDFVEAARRCLEIEKEMNELLEQYPELAEELEEEVRKMEAEQAARLAELEQLQNQLSEAEKNITEKRSDSSPGTAFVSHAQDNDEGDEGEYFEYIEANLTTIEDEGSLEELISPGFSEGESVGMESTEKSSSKEDFSLKAIVSEVVSGFLRKSKSDLKRIVEVINPVVQPVLKSGDFAWRHIKTAIITLWRTIGGKSDSQNDDKETDCEKTNK